MCGCSGCSVRDVEKKRGQEVVRESPTIEVDRWRVDAEHEERQKEESVVRVPTQQPVHDNESQ